MRRAVGTILTEDHGLPVQRACLIAWCSRTAFHRALDAQGDQVDDQGNREALAIEAGFSLPSIRVVDLLNDLIARHGAPRQLCRDNGPEFIPEALRAWCAMHGIARVFIEPGKPTRNAYIDRFNRTFREEVLDA